MLNRLNRVVVQSRLAPQGGSSVASVKTAERIQSSEKRWPSVWLILTRVLLITQTWTEPIRSCCEP